MAAVAAATAVIVVRVGRQAAGHRQAATRPQGARQRAVAEGDDPAFQLSHPTAVERAFAEREPDSYTEVVQEPRHVLTSHGVGTYRLDVLEQGEGLLDLALHVQLLGPHGQPGRDLDESPLPFGQLDAQVPQGRVEHGPHVVVLGLQNPPRSLLNLTAELLDLIEDLGVHRLLGSLWLAACRSRPGLDSGTELLGSARTLHTRHDRLQRELQQGFGVHRVVVALLALRLHVGTAAVDRPASAAILTDRAVHHGPTAIGQVEDPRGQRVGPRIRRLSLAGLRARPLLQFLLEPLPAVAIEVGEVAGARFDPDRAVVFDDLARTVGPELVVGDRPRPIAAHTVVDTLTVAAVDLDPSDDRVAGQRLNGVVVPFAGDFVLETAVTAGSAGVGRRDAQPSELVGDSFVAPVGFEPFEDPDPDRDLALVVRQEANVTALLLNLNVVVQLLDHLASPGVAQESSEAIGRPPARAVALRGPLRLHEHDPLRELAAELAALVVAEQRHCRLAKRRLAGCRWIDDDIGHHERHAHEPKVSLDHHHVDRILWPAEPILLEDE